MRLALRLRRLRSTAGAAAEAAAVTTQNATADNDDDDADLDDDAMAAAVAAAEAAAAAAKGAEAEAEADEDALLDNLIAQHEAMKTVEEPQEAASLDSTSDNEQQSAAYTDAATLPPTAAVDLSGKHTEGVADEGLRVMSWKEMMAQMAQESSDEEEEVMVSSLAAPAEMVPAMAQEVAQVEVDGSAGDNVSLPSPSSDEDVQGTAELEAGGSDMHMASHAISTPSAHNVSTIDADGEVAELLASQAMEEAILAVDGMEVDVMPADSDEPPAEAAATNGAMAEEEEEERPPMPLKGMYQERAAGELVTVWYEEEEGNKIAYTGKVSANADMRRQRPVLPHAQPNMHHGMA